MSYRCDFPNLSTPLTAVVPLPPVSSSSSYPSPPVMLQSENVLGLAVGVSLGLLLLRAGQVLVLCMYIVHTNR
jgi:hypothetical protein